MKNVKMIDVFVKLDTIEILLKNVLNMIDHGNFMINVIKHIGILKMKPSNVLSIVNVFNVHPVIIIMVRIVVRIQSLLFSTKNYLIISSKISF
jgi:hypothetical protein